MAEWLITNAGTIIVVAILALIVFLSVRTLVKNKKEGKSSCGCGCSNCGMKGSCHKS